jgi:hypothetical protein
MKFDNHEVAWKVYRILSRPHSGGRFIRPAWCRTAWYKAVANKERLAQYRGLDRAIRNKESKSAAIPVTDSSNGAVNILS